MTPMQVLVWAQHVWRQWCQGSQVLEQSRGCYKHILIPCFRGTTGRLALLGICSGLLLQWFFLWMLVVFGKPFGVSLHISAEQKAELPLPGLHCSAILGWGEALSTELSFPQPAPASSILTAAFFLSCPTQIS